MGRNICRFVSRSGAESEINIVNFVYETKGCADVKCETTYKIHLVTKGSGKLFFGAKEYDLKRGDMFFTFPSMEYSVKGIKAFEYMYISFIGIRTNKILDKLKITKNNFLFRDQRGLILIWKQSIAENKYVLSLRCEGILLYSFSVLSEREAEFIEEHGTLTEKIKNYIDEYFADKSISLDTISKAFSYNKKYISTTFKNEMHVGVAQYIATLRIQYAATLIEYGFSSVGDIAERCGFSDAQYFSKVFKKKMGVSPKEHINSYKASPCYK